ncbi:sodium:proton antiporter [Salinigranum rubrum]|uniref:Sodium:proton antiporter n=1 Tax=Salinigranum rubrum TaxID=755307 RepID=A0A2I8VHV8_9EURY|nr:cation:proton antiporter [Salinigranum rubrum]AUV81516.1 sodium:proton antiporter [Salinigranum rubrum]
MAAEAGSGIVDSLIVLLTVFIIAGGVGTLVAKIGDVPYTIALLLAGLAVSVIVSVYASVGAVGQFRDIVVENLALSHDLILLVILPPLLFEGAATTDLERLRANAVPILTLAVPGLLVSVVLLGGVGLVVFPALASGAVAAQFSLLISLLFAAMILPTDPVSVLALFEEMGAPERLSVLVEGESLINDGVGVVVFSTLYVLVVDGANPDVLFDPTELSLVLGELVVVSLGGAVVGLIAGYAVYSVMVTLDEQMTEIVLTLVLAYGSFLLAEHYLHVSGVIATVVAGLFIGNRGAEYAMSPRTKISVFNTWETAAFLVNTFIFIAIGVRTPILRLISNWHLIVGAIVLVLAARAAIVYPSAFLLNRARSVDLPRNYQHVMVWGGLHASIPIALVLGLPRSGGLLTPELTQTLESMVFGVAAFSLVVQGLTMGRLLDRLGVVTRSEAEELYELLVGRRRAVQEALDAAEALYRDGEIPRGVYEDFEAEYGNEQEDLSGAIARLFERHPELRTEQLLMGERRVLQQEKSALIDAVRSGLIASDVGDRLTEEVDLKLDSVRSGESTVKEVEEGYTEFWRERAREFGLDVGDADDGDRTDTAE